MQVIPDVVRYAVIGRLLGNGRPTATILDVAVTEVFGASRADATRQVAETVLQAWDNRIRPRQVDEWSAQAVTWVDLDDEMGSTGRFEGSWPAAGAVAGESVAFNAAILVKKTLVNGDRSRRSGRMYIPGIPEAAVSSGYTIAPADVTGWTTAVENLLADLNKVVSWDTGSKTAKIRMVVTHTTARNAQGQPTAGDYRWVDRLEVQSLLATQRRRLRG